MALTLTDRRTIYTEADSTTGWTPGSYGTVTDYAEATLAVGESLAIAQGVAYFTGSAIDLSDTLVYVYAFNNALLTPWDSSPPPIALLLGDGSDLIAFDMAGSDRRVFNHLDGPTAWQCLVLDGDQADEMDAAGNTYLENGTFAGLDLTNIVDVGCAFDTQSKALGGGYNVAVDIIRYGNDGIRLTAGTTGDRGTFLEIAIEDRSTATQKAHGILRELGTGLYGCQGPLTFGDSGAATTSYFEDSGVVLSYENRNISDGKYYFNVEGHASATNVFNLNSATISTGGPTVKADMSGGDIDTLTLQTVVFASLGGPILFSANADASGHVINDCTFEACGKVTAGAVDFQRNVISNSVATDYALTNLGGADMTGCSVSGYEGTAGTAALLYNVAADPDGELDDMSFTKGTAATAAIELGASTPATITLRGWTTSGYNASNAQNDSTIYNNSGGAVTVNVIGGAGNFSYRNGAGASTTVVIDPRTLSIEIRDLGGTLITDDTEVTLVRTSDTTELFNVEDVSTGLTSYEYTYSSDVVCYLNVLTVQNYVPRTVEPVTLINADQTIIVQLEDERGRYSNPT